MPRFTHLPIRCGNDAIVLRKFNHRKGAVRFPTDGAILQLQLSVFWRLARCNNRPMVLHPPYMVKLRDPLSKTWGLKPLDVSFFRISSTLSSA